MFFFVFICCGRTVVTFHMENPNLTQVASSLGSELWLLCVLSPELILTVPSASLSILLAAANWYALCAIPFANTSVPY